jgi:hypothetical protein
MNVIIRLLAAAVLLPVAAFCVFGFLATWRLGYAALLLLCVAGLVRLTRRGRPGADGSG